MAIIKQYHKDSNTTYVYESQYYWDSAKGQSRSKRRLIGKLDENGKVVPTGKRGPKKKEAADTPAADPVSPQPISTSDADAKLIRQLKIDNTRLKDKAAALERENTRLRGSIKKASQWMAQIQELYGETLES